jgi:hypothetical protein
LAGTSWQNAHALEDFIANDMGTSFAVFGKPNKLALSIDVFNI